MNATTLESVDSRPSHLTKMYSIPVFRGTRKPRDGDQYFGRLKLDSETAYRLGATNVGLFIESCPSVDRMVEHFRQLNESPSTTWVIVASSKQVAEDLKQRWQEAEFQHLDNEPDRAGNVIIATPEELNQLDQRRLGDVAGILIFDYACHIHKCRGNPGFRGNATNDRPQKIVDFRSRLRAGSWSPPILIFTNRRAISVNTQPMLSPYCLEAFQYIDGKTMRFGELQETPNDTAILAVG